MLQLPYASINNVISIVIEFIQSRVGLDFLAGHRPKVEAHRKSGFSHTNSLKINDV